MNPPERARVIGMLILCSALCGAACGGPIAPDQIVELTTDRSTYAHGDTAHLTLTNLGPAVIQPASIGCSSRVERSVDDDWEFAFLPRLPCDFSNFDLLPAEHRQAQVAITQENFTAPGIYRFAFDYVVKRTVVLLTVSSAAFTVE